MRDAHTCNLLFRGMIISTAAITILSSCSNDPNMAAGGSQQSSPEARTIAADVVVEVNKYRQQIGAKPLPRDRGLDNLAQSHANYLVQNRGKFSLHGKTVSHYGFDGRTLVARERLGFDSISENVASTMGGPRGAAQTFRQLWANSAGHQKNMSSKWTHTGVGVAMADDGLVIAVQLFAIKGMQSHNQMMDKMRGF